MPSHIAVAVRAHTFAPEVPLVFQLPNESSLQVHTARPEPGATIVTAIFARAYRIVQYFHYLPDDLRGRGALQLLPDFFKQPAGVRDVVRELAEEIIARFGKNKYETTIYTPNPWGAFDGWETATELEPTPTLSESAASFYAAAVLRRRAEDRLADTADSVADAETARAAKKRRYAAPPPTPAATMSTALA